ncbi:MAG TPA: CAP domain-containing protein [Gemmatimonadales bacterium]
MRFVVACLLVWTAPAIGQEYTALEAGILDEMNLARTDPAAYARFLAELLPLFDGSILRRPGEIGIQTGEGPNAVREAIEYLRTAMPLDPLERAAGLARAARDHARDQGPIGGLGHTGRDGSTMADRIARYVRWQGAISENIDYGSATARHVVISLIVDDGVASRGHRTNVFNASSRYAGVGCGPHKTYRVMCVVDYAVGVAAR